MIITSPTLGAGKNKVGGLVGWAKGTAQILRNNFRPKNPRTSSQVAARIRMANTAAFFHSLPKARQDSIIDFYISEGSSNGYGTFSGAFSNCLFGLLSEPTNISGFQSSSFEPTDYISNFSIDSFYTPDWQLTSDDNFPIQIFLNIISFDSHTSTLNAQISPSTMGHPYSALKNYTGILGVLFKISFKFAKLKYERNLVYVYGALFNDSSELHDIQFSNIGNSLGVGNSFLEFASEIRLSMYLVNQQSLYLRRKIADSTIYIGI